MMKLLDEADMAFSQATVQCAIDIEESIPQSEEYSTNKTKRNMNKNSIITALLALVAMAGQGQVKSGLDLCLRDEVTGEWLIGLFDNYAIYD